MDAMVFPCVCKFVTAIADITRSYKNNTNHNAVSFPYVRHTRGIFRHISLTECKSDTTQNLRILS